MTPHGGLPRWVDELISELELPDSYRSAIGDCVGPLAIWIEARRSESAGTLIVGINGAQGSGKSTLAIFLGKWLQNELSLRVAVISLDDLYLRKSEREALAATHHVLLRTRGVPGTHDVELGHSILDDLSSGSLRSIRIPVFEKSNDDRAPSAQWQSVVAPVDVVLFEGWCVGARPQDDAELRMPVNALEELDDSDGKWRRYVNAQLGAEYAELWARLDAGPRGCRHRHQ